MDPIIGQAEAGDGSRERTFEVRVGGAAHRLTARKDWVVPTGGGYFFAPSLHALREVLSQ